MLKLSFEQETTTVLKYQVPQKLRIDDMEVFDAVLTAKFGFAKTTFKYNVKDFEDYRQIEISYNLNSVTDDIKYKITDLLYDYLETLYK